MSEIEELRAEVKRLRARLEVIEKRGYSSGPYGSIPYPFNVPQNLWTAQEREVVAAHQQRASQNGGMIQAGGLGTYQEPNFQGNQYKPDWSRGWIGRSEG